MRHTGETAYIVGCGPSLLKLTAQDFTDGPVITLNHALLHIRKLHLPNPIYTMQQDGCLIQPIEPETVLLSRHLSRNCFSDYPHRQLFSIATAASMSTPIAVKIARRMGASELVMLAHDAYTHGDDHKVDERGSIVDSSESFPGYVQGAQQAVAMAGNVPVIWK